MPHLPIIERALGFADRIAVRSATGAHTYRNLVDAAGRVATSLLGDQDDLREAPVAFLVPPGERYVQSQWGIWRAGGVAVPLSLFAEESELEYTLTDAQAQTVITTGEFADKVTAICRRNGIQTLCIDDPLSRSQAALPAVSPMRRATILYTSGTTSKPKGVVTTHAGLQAQIESLVEAWRWRQDDRIPLFLPLHHVHGIVNVMLCALWSGAEIEAFPRFDLNVILSRVAERSYTLFMAVPTIYVRLIDAIEELSPAEREPIVQGFAAMRLMVSGSAALPASVHKRWTELTGQKLLERYGMTEIGMALSNPYDGERRPGAVGLPLPGVEVRLLAESGELVAQEGVAGEIQVRGPCVFKEYWNRAEATEASFFDGWFRTGDVAVVEQGYYRIIGRSSIDIIKSGGYKLSALEIEAALLDHPGIRQCAVVGVPDDKWGEAVATAVVLKAGESLDLDSLRAWCTGRISPYKIPQKLLVVDELPRNAMGKVKKRAVAGLFGSASLKSA